MSLTADTATAPPSIQVRIGPRKPAYVRPSALTRDLPPTIAVDPGSRRTAIVARIGNRFVGGVIITNPEPADRHTGAYAIGLSPEYACLDAIWNAIVHIGKDNALEAHHWWETNGTPVPAGTSPWLFAIEKVNPPTKRHGKVTEVEAMSVFAAKGIAEGLAARHGNPIWVRPHAADTRWEQRDTQGRITGNPYTYYPARLLAAYPVPANYEGTFPSMDHEDIRNTGVKDLCAAWSVASDAAHDYAKKSGRLNNHTVVPPAHGANVFADLMKDLRTGLEKVNGPIPKPAEQWVA